MDKALGDVDAFIDNALSGPQVDPDEPVSDQHSSSDGGEEGNRGDESDDADDQPQQQPQPQQQQQPQQGSKRRLSEREKQIFSSAFIKVGCLHRILFGGMVVHV